MRTSTSFDLRDEYIAQVSLKDDGVDISTPTDMDAQMHVLFQPISEHSLR
jgi:hypothetical protein